MSKKHDPPSDDTARSPPETNVLATYDDWAWLVLGEAWLAFCFCFWLSSSAVSLSSDWELLFSASHKKQKFEFLLDATETGYDCNGKKENNRSIVPLLFTTSSLL